MSREPVKRWGIGIQAGYGIGLSNGQIKAFPYIVGGLAVAVGDGIRKKDNPDELSLLVEQVMELSNHVIDGYVKIVDFAKYFLCGLR